MKAAAKLESVRRLNLVCQWIAGLAISLALACALHVGSATQPAAQSRPADAGPERTGQADPVEFEPAEPLDLEPGSNLASQRDHYNRIYAEAEGEQPEPNEFLVECLDRIDALNKRERSATTQPDNQSALPRGDGRPTHPSAPAALDIAMGDGRNTIALAQRGYRTVGFDIADVGVNRARRRAAELGLTIDARVDTFSDAYLQPGRWDVVAMMYFSVGRDDLERIKQSVKPGGHLIMEFAGHHPNNDTLRGFLDWQIVLYEIDFGHRDWAAKQPNPGAGMLTRLLVRRPVEP